MIMFPFSIISCYSCLRCRSYQITLGSASGHWPAPALSKNLSKLNLSPEAADIWTLYCHLHARSIFSRPSQANLLPLILDSLLPFISARSFLTLQECIICFTLSRPGNACLSTSLTWLQAPWGKVPRGLWTCFLRMSGGHVLKGIDYLPQSWITYTWDMQAGEHRKGKWNELTERWSTPGR